MLDRSKSFRLDPDLEKQKKVAGSVLASFDIDAATYTGCLRWYGFQLFALSGDVNVSQIPRARYSRREILTSRKQTCAVFVITEEIKMNGSEVGILYGVAQFCGTALQLIEVDNK